MRGVLTLTMAAVLTLVGGGATIPAGVHGVEFVYQPVSVLTGGAISLFAWAALAIAWRAHRRTIQTAVRSRTAAPASKG